MSFTISRDGNNNIIKKAVTLSTVPTINDAKSIGTTGITDIATVTTLNFNGINVTTSSVQLNYLNVTPGIATASKAAVVDSNRNITDINALSSSNLIVNGNNITAGLYSNSSSDDLNNPFLTSITAGTALASKALVSNSLINISNLNNITSKTITLNNSIISNPTLAKNININTLYNKRLISPTAISSLVSNTTTSWSQITTNIAAIDNIFWSSVCWSPELSLFVAVGSSASTSYTTTNNRVMTSTDGFAWVIRSSAADISWSSICWSSSLMLFVAIASSGGNVNNSVMTSPDGISWTSRTIPIANAWRSLCWSPELNLFVAVASSGTGNRAMSSSDGINWNLSNTVPDSNWKSICWSSELNLFVAVANSGTNRIMISSNGINWAIVSEPSGVSGVWTSICWSAELGIFVAVANSATLNKNFMRSADGINWYSSFEINNASGQVITWSKDLEIFMVIDGAGQYCSYSYDGILWTRFIITASSNVPQPGTLIWSSEYKIFLVVSDYNGTGNTAGGRIWYTYPCSIGSKGGIMCNSSNIYVNQSNNYIGINTYNPGKPLEINSVTGNCLKQIYPQDNTKYFSFDVLNTGQFNINTTKNFNIITDYLTYGLLLNNILLKSTVSEFNNYLLNITNGVAQPLKTAILNSNSSISGINLISCNSLTVNGTNIDYTGNNQYFQNISSGYTTASKALSVDLSNNIAGINNIGSNKMLLNNSYINTSSSQTINTNTFTNTIKYLKGDVIKVINTWTARATSNNSYQSICWSSDLAIFVAISSDGTNRITTSTNGILWVDVVSTVAAAGSWFSVCWSPELGLFVAIGTSGIYIMTSIDGTNWIGRTVPENNQWKSLCWSSELCLFVAVASSGTNRSMISYNGINWYKFATASNLSWTNICWANTLGLFIATATDSVTTNIMSSPDGINWTTRSTPIAQQINSISWSQELGILVTACGNVNYNFYSKDGINWYSNLLPATLTWNLVSWISDIGIFVMFTVSTIGILYSFDGLTWISITISGTSPYFSSIAWSSELNMLVVSSYNGTAGFKMYTSEIFNPNSKSCILSNSLDFTVNNTNGRVGIGISSPSYQLQLSTDSASKASTSSWTVSSDSRLKENIQDADLNICYNNIKNLRLTKYTWRDDVYTNEQVPDRSKLGWIAQEVETIFPKSVQKINDHGFSDCRTLNIDQIIASLYGFSQKMITNYEADDILLNSISEKVNEIQLFLDNIPEV